MKCFVPVMYTCCPIQCYLQFSVSSLPVQEMNRLVLMAYVGLTARPRTCSHHLPVTIPGGMTILRFLFFFKQTGESTLYIPIARQW